MQTRISVFCPGSSGQSHTLLVSVPRKDCSQGAGDLQVSILKLLRMLAKDPGVTLDLGSDLRQRTSLYCTHGYVWIQALITMV